MDQHIKALIDDYKDYIIKLRRHFHRHPELSGQEYETARYIKEEIINDRLEIRQMTETGFIAILDTQRPGPTLGLRTDLDALPIEESPMNLSQHRLVSSDHAGCMHACGHDGHLAILLTTLEILWQMRDSLRGRIIFIFEEAEETAGSIRDLVDQLKAYEWDAIYGNHLYSSLDTGKAIIAPGPVMSGAGHIDLTIHGKSGHASRPDEAVNPIFAGASLLNALSIGWNNQRNITETVTLGITKFNSGDTWNIIEDQAKIGGTLRFFSAEAAYEAVQLFKDMATHICQAHNCWVEFDPSMNEIFMPTINHADLSDLVHQALDKMDGELQAVSGRWFASETFSEYSKLCPTYFTLVGTKNEAVGSGAAHHNEHFDLDEGSLSLGAHLMTQVAVDFCKQD